MKLLIKIFPVFILGCIVGSAFTKGWLDDIHKNDKIQLEQAAEAHENGENWDAGKKISGENWDAGKKIWCNGGVQWGSGHANYLI